MRLYLCLPLLLLAVSSQAFAEDPCHATNGMTIRVRAPDNTLTSVSWEGDADCAYTAQDLLSVTAGGAVNLVIPDSEFTGLTSGPLTITAVAERPELKQDIVVTLTKTTPLVTPKLYFYFADYANSETSIEQMRTFEQSQRIYQNFYLARKLAREGANANITATGTYFYYQSAILIDPSQQFSKGSMRVSDDARVMMKALLNTLADSSAPDHDADTDAIERNYRRLIRPIPDLRNEVGLPPLAK